MSVAGEDMVSGIRLMTDRNGTAIRSVHPVLQRRLTALVHADVVGFSLLVGLDDRDTSLRLRQLRSGLIKPLLDRHGGTLVNTAGLPSFSCRFTT